MRQPFEAAVSWSYDSPAKGGLHHAHYPGRVANMDRFSQMDKQSGCAGIRHYVMWLQFCPRSRLSKSDTMR